MGSRCFRCDGETIVIFFNGKDTNKCTLLAALASSWGIICNASIYGVSHRQPTGQCNIVSGCEY